MSVWACLSADRLVEDWHYIAKSHFDKLSVTVKITFETTTYFITYSLGGVGFSYNFFPGFKNTLSQLWSPFPDFANTIQPLWSAFLSFTNTAPRLWNAFRDFTNAAPPLWTGILSFTNRAQRLWSPFRNFKNTAPQRFCPILNFTNRKQPKNATFTLKLRGNKKLVTAFLLLITNWD